MFIRRARLSGPVLAGSALLLSACGGGTSQSGSDATITAANYQSYDSQMGRAVVGASVGSAFGTSTGSGGVSGAGAHRQPLVAGVHGRPFAIDLGDFLRNTAMIAAARPQVSVSAPPSACPGGGQQTVTWADTNNNASLDPGDTITFSMDHCQLDASGVTVNGSFSMTFNQLRTSGTTVTALNVSGTFDNFSTEGITLNGGYGVSLTRDNSGSDTITVSLTNTVLTAPGASETMNLAVTGTLSTDGSFAFSVNGTLTIDGNTFTLAQITPFVAPVDLPTSGSLRLRDVPGNTITMQAQSNSTVDFTFNGTGGSTASATGQSWSSFGG